MRRRKLVIATATLFAFVLLATVSVIFLAWRRGDAVESRLAAIRADGAPAGWKEIAPPEIPKERNAAAALAKVYPKLALLTTALQSEGDVRELADQMFAGAAKPEKVEAVRLLMDKHSETIAALIAASDCPEYVTLVDFALPHDVGLNWVSENGGNLRTACRLLRLEAALALEQGDVARAFDVLLVCLDLASKAESEPLIASMLTSIAVQTVAMEDLDRLLRAYQLDGAQHRRLHAALAGLHDSPSLVRTLQTERAFGIDSFSGIVLQTAPAGMKWVGDLIWRKELLHYLDLMESYIAIAGSPGFDSKKPLPPASSARGGLTGMMEKQMHALFQATARRRLDARCSRIVARVYELDLADAESVELSGLDLPTDAITNPFTGDLLKLDRGPNGWTAASEPFSIDLGGDVVRVLGVEQ